MTDHTYYRPDTLDEALSLLRELDQAIPLAGGTEVLAHLNTAWPPHPPVALVDLQALPFRGVESSAEEVRLGALTTLQTVVQHPEVHELAGGLVSIGAWLAASFQIRNQATIGGALLGGSAARSALAALLLALNADLVFAPTPDSRETVPLETFYANGGRTNGDLLVEVVIGRPAPGARAALHRIGRTPADAPIVVVAGVGYCDGGQIGEVRLAVGGVGRYPVRLRDTERALAGTAAGSEEYQAAVAAAAARLEPISDVRGSAEYRAAMVPILVGRVLDDLCAPAE